MKCIAATMQRNEDQCLVPWVRYHARLLGAENLVVIDHASTSEITCRNLDLMERDGIKLKRLSAAISFRDKGPVMVDALNEFGGDADFVFPIDCDEMLVAVKPDGLPTCHVPTIFNAMWELADFRGKFRIEHSFPQILGHGVHFWKAPYQKLFFRGGEPSFLDNGFHVGESTSGPDTHVSRLGYAHFHYKSYAATLELSREKLRPWVDVDDLEAVRAFNGIGFHLKNHLLRSKAEYEAQFVLDNRAFRFAEIEQVLAELAIDPNFTSLEAIHYSQAFRPAPPAAPS